MQMERQRHVLAHRLKEGPIARNSLGTLSAISQAILVGMLSFFHRVYIGTLLSMKMLFYGTFGKKGVV